LMSPGTPDRQRRISRLFQSEIDAYMFHVFGEVWVLWL
jgi:hypothetical protein